MPTTTKAPAEALEETVEELRQLRIDLAEIHGRLADWMSAIERRLDRLEDLKIAESSE
jgi:hypothetical protein